MLDDEELADLVEAHLIENIYILDGKPFDVDHLSFCDHCKCAFEDESELSHDFLEPLCEDCAYEAAAESNFDDEKWADWRWAQ